MALITVFGDAGTGKSQSLGTILDGTEYKLIVVSTERKAQSGLASYIRMNNIDREKWKGRLHFVTIRPKSVDVKAHLQSLDRTARVQAEDIFDHPDVRKDQVAVYMRKVMETLSFLISDTNTELGKMDELGNKTVVVIDNLTALVDYAEMHVKGLRPGLSFTERNSVQYWIKILISNLKTVSSMPNAPHIVVLGHAAQVSNGEQKMPQRQVLISGQALNEWYVSQFNDVILSTVDQGKFIWSNQRAKTITRSGYLPKAPKHPQDYRPLLANTAMFDAEDAFGDF